ncbi:VOC family protein [Cellulomonas chengniuliangii]|uniref:VOC family protein n=1 Tax=Cellulomonas chengniuliangii TaxID=2968084 RepID=UPI001D0E3E9C|nr:VOC family protein [Cellulomonas chengniuliangii]MCC2317329.1 hypothetical protein [Cellulomonas chengniuliangii]
MELVEVIVRVVVTDLPTSTLWYQRLLDLEPVEPDDGTSVFVLTPSTTLQLVEKDEITPAEPGCSLSLRVPDLRGAAAHVDGLGLRRSETATLGERAGAFTMVDPDGREVTILQVASA